MVSSGLIDPNAERQKRQVDDEHLIKNEQNHREPEQSKKKYRKKASRVNHGIKGFNWRNQQGVTDNKLHIYWGV